MVKTVLFGIFHAVNKFLHRPWTVFWVCVGLAFLNLVVDGTLLRLWSLHRDYSTLQRDSVTLQTELKTVQAKIHQAKDPEFMEREARDRFDLVGKGDLVFVFTGDEAD